MCCLFLDSLVIFLTFTEFRKRLRRLTYYLEIYIRLIFEILLNKIICNRYIFQKRAPDFLLFDFLINLQLNCMVLYQIYSKFYIWAKSCQNCDRPRKSGDQPRLVNSGPPTLTTMSTAANLAQLDF